MIETVTRVSLRRRLEALATLAGTLAFVVTVAVILFHHGARVILGLVGSVLAVTGGSAEKRTVRDVRIGDLFAVAAGREPRRFT